MTAAPPFHRSPPAEPTVAELIRYGADEFERAGLAFGHGTGDASDEAAALVFHALGLVTTTLPQRPMTPGRPQTAGADAAPPFAAAHRARVPVAYLMGRMWFAGLEFEVDERVIVPRSPFAELIAAGFEPWIDPARVRTHPRHRHGLGLHRHRLRARDSRKARVDAVDLSAARSRSRRRNVARHGVAGPAATVAGRRFRAAAAASATT